MLQAIFSSPILPQVLTVLICVNIVLSALSQIFHALSKDEPATFVDKVIAVLSKILDWISANIKH